MAAKTEKLFNRLYKIAACEEGETALRMILGEVGTEYGLTGAYLLTMSEKPFVFDMTAPWEKNPYIGDETVQIDMSCGPDLEKLSVFSGKERILAISDTEAASDIRTVADLAGSIEAAAMVMATVADDGDNLGILLFTDSKVREWTPDELQALKETADALYCTILRIRREETHRILLENATARMEEAIYARDQFLINISRDIRTPINSAVGMVSIMKHNEGNADIIAQCLDRLDGSARQLMNMINECVEKTVTGQDDKSLNPEWIRLDELFGGIKDSLSSLEKGRKQEFVFEFDSELEVNVDLNKLKKIIFSLIVDASRYSPEGGRVQVIAAKEHSGQKDMLVVRVKDSGEGMTDEQRLHFFDPYYAKRLGGRGHRTELEMAIVRQLVETMHGSIEVFAEKGVGSEIVLDIPVELRAIQAQPETVDETVTASEFAEMYIGRRILIAEDNVLMAEVIATILGYRGLETDMALNGREALEKYLENDPFYYDLIFMDIQMPEMDGLEAAREIRASGRADAGMIPIAALSANAMKEDVQKSLDSGMNVHLIKPVGEKELFETISQYVM